MKLLVWNIQKRQELVAWAIRTYKPDVMLFQELPFTKSSWELGYDFVAAESFRKGNVRMGVGVYARGSIGDLKIAMSQHGDFRAKFWLGKVYKAALACQLDEYGIWVGNIHAYNGWPRKSIDKLVDHVMKLALAIPPGVPAILAGDFNTWTEEHLLAVIHAITPLGFKLAYSAEYDSEKSLDHVFYRDVNLKGPYRIRHLSDHPGIILEVV